MTLQIVDASGKEINIVYNIPYRVEATKPNFIGFKQKSPHFITFRCHPITKRKEYMFSIYPVWAGLQDNKFTGHVIYDLENTLNIEDVL